IGSQINSKGFQGVFSIFFYTKKMLVKFTNIKKYRAKKGCDKNGSLSIRTDELCKIKSESE
ncbi:hypothetical protein ACUTE6_14005, partial [Enterococcus faecium]